MSRLQLIDGAALDESMAIEYIYQGLREWNKREICAGFASAENPIEAAKGYHINTPAIRKFVYLDGFPIAVGGCIPVDRGFGRLYLVGRPELEHYGALIIRLLRKFLEEIAYDHGVQTLESWAMMGNPKSPRWFAALGGVLNRIERDRHGNHFEVYVWRFL